ncbi:DUF4233 domain-containing protein [Mycetocola tolaasinivorans]|uniref:DUF4233 domain-containing protein n=1 Tax=Mycetocola tolaasinivorans TaxID=76635 RepID=A0A3L6ZXK8_9MICO|nr:DUF4233 domain-containing protein [Mycetocola tolaasinivorans]RLP72756.1 DUF4233 domain-containing protein [Mycetocola tolaasinivorans]
MATRVRRQRGVKESLLSIILGFQIIIVGLAALLVFGLKASPGEPWYALVAGGVVVVIMLIALGTLRSPLGEYLGWFVQLCMVAAGFLVGEIWVVAAMFLALWIFGVYKGTQLDDRNAAFRAAQEAAGE